MIKTMNKILLLPEKILNTYAIVYAIIMHLIVIGTIASVEMDFSKPIADIVLMYIIFTVIFLLCNLCFLIPYAFVIAIGTLISIGLSISIPLFLFLSLFQVLGAQSVNVLEYGFINTLLFCIVATPIGIMNLKSLKVLWM